jgi:hypothetical protein
VIPRWAEIEDQPSVKLDRPTRKRAMHHRGDERRTSISQDDAIAASSF